MKKSYIISALAIFALASCAKEIENARQVAPIDTHTVKFVAGAPETKTSVDISDKTNAVYSWNTSGETFMVLQNCYNGSTFKKNYKADATEVVTTSNSVSFSASLPASSDYTNYKYLVVYPSNVFSYAKQDLVNLTLKNPQGATTTAYDPKADMMVSNVKEQEAGVTSSETLNLEFLRLVTIGKLTIKNLPVSGTETIKSVSLDFAGKELNGEFVYKPSDESVTVSGDGKISVEYESGATISSNEDTFDVWFTCAPFTLSVNDSYLITVTTDQAVYTKSATKTKGSEMRFGRGNVTSFSANFTGVKRCLSVSKTGFSEVSGNIDEDGDFTYEAKKGNASNAPIAYDQKYIRLYQASSGSEYGGYLDITATAGDKINSITITTTNEYSTCPVVIQVADEEFDINKATFVAKNSSYTVGNLDTDCARVYCCGTNKNTRLEIASITITYVADARSKQTLSFPQASYNATLGSSFTAPTLSGAMTTPVYSSSDEAVAKVDASTGAVTLVAAGECTITAAAPESDTYKKGKASYILTVSNGVTGISGIKELATSSEDVQFTANLTDAIVTAMSENKKSGYIQDETGAINIYLSDASTLVARDKINGTVTGTATKYNGVKEITAIDFSKATITHNADLPLQTVTIAALNASYSTYEYCRIKIEGATVTGGMTTSDPDGEIKQGDNKLALRSSYNVTLDEEAIANIICFPSYYQKNNTGDITNRAIIFDQADITVVGGPNKITMDATKTIKVDEEWTIGATCLSDGTVTYEVTAGTDVISITDGVVKGLKAGTATITATSPTEGNYTAATANCTVTVVEASATYIVKYTVSSRTEVTTSGTAPDKSSATFNNTYTSNKEQMTKGNSMTLTLSGFSGKTITGIKLKMHSNAKAGAGTFLAKVGDSSIASISTETTFNNWYDSGSYSTSYKDINVTLTDATKVVGTSETIVIIIAATTNSLYCQSFEITYK